MVERNGLINGNNNYCYGGGGFYYFVVNIGFLVIGNRLEYLYWYECLGMLKILY